MDNTYVTVDKTAGYYQYTVDGKRVRQQEFERYFITYFDEWLKTNKQEEPRSITNDVLAKAIAAIINEPDDKQLRL
jgi:hypothetical protein